MVFVVAGLAALAACSDGNSTPPSIPTGTWTSGDLRLGWEDWEYGVPEPGSTDVFQFIVDVTNVSGERFTWPDPCPKYRWSWVDGTATYGMGEKTLKCREGSTLEPGREHVFPINAPAATSGGATHFRLVLVAPPSCNLLEATFETDPGNYGEVLRTIEVPDDRCQNPTPHDNE